MNRNFNRMANHSWFLPIEMRLLFHSVPTQGGSEIILSKPAWILKTVFNDTLGLLYKRSVRGEGVVRLRS